MSELEHLISELRRRRVFRTAAAYLAGAFVVLQVADLTFEPLGLPANAYRALIIIAGFGFPLAVIASWFFDVKRAESRPRLRTRAAGALALFVLICTGFMAYGVLRHWNRADAGTDPLRRADGGGPAAQRAPSIAVLPFANVGNTEDDYFAEGMTDEITSRLGAVRGLGVVPSRVTERYARTDKTLREIGTELGVEYVLLGNVRWAGQDMAADGKVRVTLELLRVADERQLWSNRYDRVIDDIFAVQTDIATQVIDRLGVTLAEPERRRVRATPAENHEAYTLYLKGRHFWNKRTKGSVQAAQSYFQQAVDVDPSYSLAWVGIADVWITRGWYSLLAPRDAFPQAKEAALRALQFDSTLAEAHASLAHIYFEFDHDWAAAEREYLRAIELKPGYATAHHWYGGFLSAMGRHQLALQHAERARSLDPIAPIIQTWKGLRYYFAGNHEAAIAEYTKALELDGSFAPAHWHMGWAYEQSGRFGEGITAAQRALAADTQSLLYLTSLGHAHAKAGNTSQARLILARLAEASRTRHVPAYHVAMIHLALGETGVALDWLDRAHAEKSPWIGYLNVDPRVSALRSHPRFQALLRKARLAQ